MKKAELYRMMDLMEDIKKVDSLISLHQEMETSDLMVSQYRAKMTMLVGQLVDELASPPVVSASSFSVIQQLLNKYINTLSKGESKKDKEFDQLLAAI